MSTPQTHDPLTVTTLDGCTWTRRALTRDGRGLYALANVRECPDYVLATLLELAEHGVQCVDPLATIVAEVGALPVPVGDPIPSELTEKAAPSPRRAESVAKLRDLIARQREDTYTSPLHHDYAIPHDLPETGVRP
ncbi:hypothetical protein [Streptomyces wuyuanensis]|uniref:Uncharacterized protein n=1 Tax=Streptomyces wuyuanensis TaxID=1196353 RepID=A0A1G9VVM1_9ACTN|nr:hypothetical protein [Streptomyces wuyuanensis]SDM76298.1 hypothetical protein SAMN05444921_11310 [Streptomyces wuyuanensis]